VSAQLVAAARRLQYEFLHPHADLVADVHLDGVEAEAAYDQGDEGE
jgi:hypothetical protein